VSVLNGLTEAIDRTRTEVSTDDDAEDETRVILSNRMLPLVGIYTVAAWQIFDVM
jgi:hypothetical protein